MGGISVSLFPEYTCLISNFPCAAAARGGATSIENDHDFSVALATLMKKKKDTCGVGVEFDLDTMDGFRIRKRVCYFYLYSIPSMLTVYSLTLKLTALDKITKRNFCTGQRYVLLYYVYYHILIHVL